VAVLEPAFQVTNEDGAAWEDDNGTACEDIVSCAATPARAPSARGNTAAGTAAHRRAVVVAMRLRRMVGDLSVAMGRA